jgi:purine-binding chemotaxis protein CheW
MNGPENVIYFSLCNQMYSLPLSCVQEILPAVKLIPVAGSPRFVAGLLNVRGRVMPVIDLASLLGVQSGPLHYTDHLIVLTLNGENLAIRADKTNELGTVPATIGKVPFASMVTNKFTQHNDALVAVLEPDLLYASLKCGSSLQDAALAGGLK